MWKIVIILSLVGVLAGIGFVWRSLTNEHYGFEVDSVDWLPDEARMITFFEDGIGNRIAEFEIDQEAFERWCAEIGRPLRVVKENDRDVQVGRALDLLERRGVIVPLNDEGETLEELDARLSRRYKKFGAGDLYHGEVWRNGGGYRIGYDSTEGKGYYSFSRN